MRAEILERAGRGEPSRLARLALGRSHRYAASVSTISAILEPDSEGSLHLPVPEALRGHKVKVVASFEVAEPDAISEVQSPSADQLRKLPAEVQPVSPEAARRVEALRSLGATMKARGVDFVQWGKDIREARR